MGRNNNHNNGHVEMKKSWLIKRSPWNLARHRMLAQWDQIISKEKVSAFSVSRDCSQLSFNCNMTFSLKKSSKTQGHKTIYECSFKKNINPLWNA
jgi:hypothetical protein